MRPQVVILDRDGTITVSSSDPSSPLYYLDSLDSVILRPGAREAAAVIRAHKVPIYLATKQRCISKGLVSRETVNLINARVERLLGVSFAGVLVEENAEDKRALYEAILGKPLYRGWHPDWFHLFDDSVKEREVAARLGLTTHDGGELYEATLRAFDVR